MPFALFDDKFPRHPKVRPLSDGAFRLHVSAICHCAEWLTDGRIRYCDVAQLVPRFRPRHLEELLAVGLWIDDGSSYLIHDYLDWNRSRAEVEATRARKSKAGRRGAELRWQKP